MRKEISYVMAPDDHFYTGMVMRRVTATLDNGQRIVLSETTTGMELDEFQEQYPTTPVDGQKGSTIREELAFMTDEQLEAMGLKRMDGVEQVSRPGKVQEVLKSDFHFPAHEGYGWYKLSTTEATGNRAKGKAEAIRRQAAIDAGNPDPEDVIPVAEPADEDILGEE